MRTSSARGKRVPLLGRAVQRARAVRAEVGYKVPWELPVEVLAHIRHALVRNTPTIGSRANLLRLGRRGVIGVAEGLANEQRRWAIAHELGHFETHTDTDYLGLCIGEDLRTNYDESGLEQEANAFAAELLMPEDVFAPKTDVAAVDWSCIGALSTEFQVSMTAAALRFLAFTYDRVALVACKGGRVEWCQATRDFGQRPARGATLDARTIAFDFFARGSCCESPEEVAAEAWVETDAEIELIEHALPMTKYGVVMSLLWLPER